LSNEENIPKFLLDTEAATHAAVLKTIERFTMAGDFRVVDVTADTSCWSVQGKRALSYVKSVLDVSESDLSDSGVAQIAWHEKPVTIIRASHTAEDGVDIIVDRKHGAELAEELANVGAVPVEEDTFETLRIEAGVPRFGKDMDETNVVSETNLDDAVSFTKGCYIGQEIIARIKYRGHVAKKLSGVVFEDKRLPAIGAVIRSIDAKDIGRVTSAAVSPTLERAIALSYVRYEYLAPGTQVVVGEEGLGAKVTELPFVRSSSPF
jgi:folate-binding protein YgfZ